MKRLLAALRSFYSYYRVPTVTCIANEVLNAIGAKLNWYGAEIKMLDKFYRVPSDAGFRNSIKGMWGHQRDYTAETYDCDNFATWFWAWAAGLGMTSVGMVLDDSGQHAYNVVVTYTGTELEAHFVEPQTGEYVAIRRGKYQLTSALILVG